MSSLLSLGSTLAASPWLGSAALALFLLSPALGALPVMLHCAVAQWVDPQRRPKRRHALALVWAIFFGLLLTTSGLFYPERFIFWLSQTLVVSIGLYLFTFSRRTVWLSCLSALVVVSVLLPVERALSAERWYRYGDANPVVLTEPQTLVGDSTRAPFERRWQLTGEGTPTLSLTLQRSSGLQGWDWLRFPDDITVTPERDDSDLVTRIHFPARGDNYVTREWYHDTPLGGERVRLTARLRLSPSESSNIGRVVQGTCQGLRLRVVGTSEFACGDVPLSTEWQPVELTWQIPVEVSAKQLRVAINNLDGYTIDVTDVTLEMLDDNGRWQTLGPLTPNGVTLALHNHVTGAVTHRSTLVRDDAAVYRLDADAPWAVGQEVRATLRIETDLAVTVDDDVLSKVDATAQPLPPRQQLWFSHPNLAGHTVAVLALLALYVAKRRRDGLVVILLATIALWFVGSRTAWLVTAVGAGGWLWLRSGWIYRIGLVFAGVLALGTLATLGIPDSLTPTLERTPDQAPRPLIWIAAWQTFVQHPWRGSGDTFVGLIQTRVADTPYAVVSHAHNLWLELASHHGLLGLLAALSLTVGLSYLAWRRARWAGLAFVVPVLLTQITDYTLFYGCILFAFVIGLGMLGSNEATPNTVATKQNSERAAQQRKA